MPEPPRELSAEKARGVTSTCSTLHEIESGRASKKSQVRGWAPNRRRAKHPRKSNVDGASTFTTIAASDFELAPEDAVNKMPPGRSQTPERPRRLSASRGRRSLREQRPRRHSASDGVRAGELARTIIGFQKRSAWTLSHDAWPMGVTEDAPSGRKTTSRV